MQQYRREDRGYYPTTAQNKADFHPIDVLLSTQRKGGFLTPEEKKRILNYAESQRKKKVSK